MDRRAVEALAGMAVSQAEIATVLAITLPTLRKHYRAELDRGAALVEAELVRNLIRLAGGSDGVALRAIMFSLQCRFGWSPFAPRPNGPAAA
ncbi:MAG: hypothetical protein EOS13_21730 [Mesorhizobium sp.]|nr:hypothetical protein [Mesorhizobium sp.]RWO51140.1 MAG: hypothetical protein EOS13_21730 [Mesorhizobium sp.]